MTPSDKPCPHCRRPVAPDEPAAPYCCRGCDAAAALLSQRGLGRFYELSTEVNPGEADPCAMPWLPALLQRARALASGGQIRLTLDVQGVHCAGCVWLIQQLFADRPGGVHVDLNPGLGRMELIVVDDAFDLEGFLTDLLRVGYRSGPPLKDAAAISDGLAVRLGVSAAIALNSMTLSAAVYFGLSAEDGGLYTVFGWLNLGLATLAVLVGGPVFFRGAWAALRRRALHLDVPIALGIVLAWAGSTWLFVMGRPDSAYFDTLTVFIALMLVGRFLQRRWIERSRRLLLADAGLAGASVRVTDDDGTVSFVPVEELQRGARLLLAPGELVPVDAALTSPSAELSLAWINGESEPVGYERDAILPAGAHLVGRQAVAAIAAGDFADSSLHHLLTPGRQGEQPERDGFWHAVSAIYVAVVLLFGAIAAAAWWGAGVERALEVTVAVLVITCPCAIGLATPLAYELAHASLRRRGLVVRRQRFLGRARHVRKVLFDKTGTLTLSEPALTSTAPLERLDEHQRGLLFQLVVRSNHPKSRTLLAALTRLGDYRLDDRLSVTEQAGRGVVLSADEVEEAGLVAGEPEGVAGDRPLLFEVGGREVARFTFTEQLRRGAAAGISRLQSAGLDVWLLSGDRSDRVTTVADALGIGPDRALAECTPEFKAAHVTALDRRDTMVIGDGINDALAFDAAWVAGTPAIDRPALPARADFYLMTQSLAPVAESLRTARRLHRVIQRNLVFAVLYNGAGIALALAGLLPPVVCAIAMPLSSLAVIALTTAGMAGARSRRATAAPSGRRPALSPDPTGVTP